MYQTYNERDGKSLWSSNTLKKSIVKEDSTSINTGFNLFKNQRINTEILLSKKSKGTPSKKPGAKNVVQLQEQNLNVMSSLSTDLPHSLVRSSRQVPRGNLKAQRKKKQTYTQLESTLKSHSQVEQSTSINNSKRTMQGKRQTILRNQTHSGGFYIKNIRILDNQQDQKYEEIPEEPSTGNKGQNPKNQHGFYSTRGDIQSKYLKTDQSQGLGSEDFKIGEKFQEIEKSESLKNKKKKLSAYQERKLRKLENKKIQLNTVSDLFARNLSNLRKQNRQLKKNKIFSDSSRQPRNITHNATRERFDLFRNQQQKEIGYDVKPLTKNNIKYFIPTEVSKISQGIATNRISLQDGETLSLLNPTDFEEYGTIMRHQKINDQLRQHIDRTEGYRTKMKQYRIGSQNLKLRTSAALKSKKGNEKVFKNEFKYEGYTQNYILVEADYEYDLDKINKNLNDKRLDSFNLLKDLSFADTCKRLSEELQKYPQPSFPKRLKYAQSNFNDYYIPMNPALFQKRIPLLVQKHRLNRLITLVQEITLRKSKEFFFDLEELVTRQKDEEELLRIKEEEERLRKEREESEKQEETKSTPKDSQEQETSKNEKLWKLRQELMKKRKAKEEARRRKRLEIEEKLRQEKEAREALMKMQKQRNLEIMQRQLELSSKKRHHKRATHLKVLNNIYGVNLANNYLHKLIQKSNYIYQKRIPDIYPAYDSIWMGMINKVNQSSSFTIVPMIGYYDYLKIRVEKFCAYKYYQHLPEDLQISFKQNYEMFCKISADLDIDILMCDWIKGLEERENISEGNRGYVKGKRFYGKKTRIVIGRGVDEVLELMNFNGEVDFDYLRLEFGQNIQEVEEKEFSKI